MSEVWNVGKDVISAYLSGLQHKERREALVNQALYRQQQMQIAADKIEEGRKKFLETHKLDTEKFKLDQDKLASEDAYRKAQMNKIGYDIRRGGLDILGRAKDLVGQNGQPLDLGEVLDPTANAIRRKTPEQIATEAANQTSRTTQAVEDVKQPNRRENAILQGNINQATQADRLAAQAVENEKNRQARHQDVTARVNATYAKINAKETEKKEVDDRAVEVNMPDLLTGDTSIEKLNKMYPKQTVMRITNAAKEQKLRLFGDKDIAKFGEAPEVTRFLENVRTLKDQYENYDLLGARTTSGLLQPALGLFGRNTFAEKGNLSNQDIARIGKLIPKLSYRNVDNAKVVAEIEDIIYGSFEQKFKGMDAVQRKAVEERYNIPIRPSKEDGKRSPVGNINSKSNTVINKAGEEVERVK